MDNCLQLITKFPRDVKTRACVTPRKNFADGIMENTGSEIREREKWIEVKSKRRRNCEKIVVIRKSDAHDSFSPPAFPVGKTFNKFHGLVVETRKKLTMNL